MTMKVECPCCEHDSTKAQWYEISNDNFLVCPVCSNACTPDEFKPDTFEGGITMTTETKLTLPEQMREEFCRLYDLEPHQVKLEVGIFTPDVEKGRRILKDFNMYHKEGETYLNDLTECDKAFGELIDTVWVYKRDRDGFI